MREYRDMPQLVIISSRSMIVISSCCPMILVMSFPGISDQEIDNDRFGAVAALHFQSSNCRFVPIAAITLGPAVRCAQWAFYPITSIFLHRF
jgi:hypothetical protein